MKTIFRILLACACCLSVYANPDVVFTLSNFQISPVTNRTVQIQPMTVPNANNSSVVVGDMISTNSGTGTFTLTNASPNYLYQVKILAPPSITMFKLFPTNASGTIQAYNCLVADSTATFPAGSVAWAAATSDLRYAPASQVISNAVLLSGTNVFTGTNTFTLPAIFSNSITFGGVTLSNWPSGGTSGGITNLNGITNAWQSFSVGTNGQTNNIVSSGTNTQFNFPRANATNTGDLTSNDWAVFNAKQSALGFTPPPNTRLISTTSPLTGGGDLSADRTLVIPKATGGVDGYLAQADFTTFSNKQAALGYTPVAPTRQVLTTSPLTGGNNLSNDVTIAIPPATSTVNGYLTSADWTSFATKQQNLSSSLPLQIAGPNLSITQSGTSGNGFLTSGDWNTFNAKQAGNSTLTNWSTIGTNLVAYTSQLGTAAYTNIVALVLKTNGFATGLTNSNSVVQGTWQATNGAVNGYVWTSDGSGNGTWVAASAGSGGIATLNGVGTNTALTNAVLNNATTTNTLIVSKISLPFTTTPTLILSNGTAATIPNKSQYSPALSLYGNGWDSGSSASIQKEIDLVNQPAVNSTYALLQIIGDGTNIATFDPINGMTAQKNMVIGSSSKLKFANYAGSGNQVPYIDNTGLTQVPATADMVPAGSTNIYYNNSLVQAFSDNRYIRHSIKTITADYTMTTNDWDIIANGSGNITVSLLQASQTTNVVVFKNLTANNLVIAPFTPDTIEGATLYTNKTVGRSDVFQSDGSSTWRLIANYYPGGLVSASNLLDVLSTNTALSNLGGLNLSDGTNLVNRMSNNFVASLSGTASNTTFKGSTTGNVPITSSVIASQYTNAFEVKSNTTVLASISSNGVATVSGIKMTNTPVNGYVLTTDGSGNGSWLPAGGGSANTNAWTLGGNAGTTSTNYLGTSDNQPLYLKANGLPAMTLQPISAFVVNVTLGSSQNIITSSGVADSILGGQQNLMTNITQWDNIDGGDFNIINNYSDSFISGGFQNTIGNGVAFNAYSGILGGNANTNLGDSSLIGGVSARAVHNNSFVWSDGTIAPFTTTANKQFIIYSANGVGINTNATSTAALTVAGNVLITGAGNLQITNNRAAGYVLTSDANGVGTWQAPTAVTGSQMVLYTSGTPATPVKPNLPAMAYDPNGSLPTLGWNTNLLAWR